MKVVVCYKEPVVRDEQVTYLLWNSYSESITEGIVSIPRLVEAEAITLRKLYLELVYELGERKIDGRTVTELLEIREGFSFWWMTLIAEKCNFSKSPEVNDVIKLFAFNNWAKKNDVTELVLMMTRPDLIKCFELWCNKRKVQYHLVKRSDKALHPSQHAGLQKILPYRLQAFAWLLVYLVKRWKLSGLGIKEWTNSNGTLSFFSYLINLVPSEQSNGEFGSRIWTNLPDKLQRNGVKTNWLHMYAKSHQVPDITTAKKIITSFNKNANGLQCHVMLESFLSLRIVGNMLADWLKISRKSKKIETALKTVEIGGINVWPLLQADWRQSAIGKTAMSNIWHLNLFEQALQSIGKQEKAVYLLENMDWEFAYLWGWKKFGHGIAVGFAHSMVRFWDLRYFFDNRSYDKRKKNSLPMPDKIAVNGRVMRDTMLEAGYQEDMLVNVEALRYNYMVDILDRVQQQHVEKQTNGKLKFLVLGDSQPQDTTLLVNILKKALGDLGTSIDLVVKSHPLCPISKDIIGDSKVVISDEPLEKLLPLADLVYAGSMTSAAVEAYLFGIPVISLLNTEILNFSPLRSVKGVYFISSHQELIKAVEEIASTRDQIRERPKDFFYINKDLLLWKQLLPEA